MAKTAALRELSKLCHLPRLRCQYAVSALGLKTFLGGELGLEVCSHLLSLCVGSSPRKEAVAGHAQLITDLPVAGLEALRVWKAARLMEEADNPPNYFKCTVLLSLSDEVRMP